MAKIKGQPFRSNAPKISKARNLKDGDGWFSFPCCQCGKPALYRKRQRHPERAKCVSCRTAAS